MTRTQHASTGADRLPGAPLVVLRDVVKRYESDAGTVTALDGIDLEVGTGEFAAVVGKSGSGKSTLINVIAGIGRPTSGEIVVGDTPLHVLSHEALAAWRSRHLGIVFQFFQLLPTLSLLDNVMLPMVFAGTYPAREQRERAHHLLDTVGLAEHSHKLPGTVSGGQQQRAAIARALANDPPLLVCDEPTGNLDSSSAARVFDLFCRLVDAGTTILMVTHDQALAAQVTRIIEILDGRIVRDDRQSASSP